MDNLLSNAYKYTPEGGHIAVQLSADDEQATICISDSGIGIPPEQIPALFAKYHRVPGESSRKILGTGLGLLIVKEIVGAHGGSISAASEGIEGKGTTFTVTIPLRSSTSESSSVETPTEVDFLSESQTADEPSNSVINSLTKSQHQELFEAFIHESNEQVAALHNVLRQLGQHPTDQPAIKIAQRLVHTLKGNAAALRIDSVADLAANMEVRLRQVIKENTILTTADIAALEWTLSEIDYSIAQLNA